MTNLRNIPILEALEILANLLKQNNKPRSHIDEIMKMTTIITQEKLLHLQ